MNVRSILTLTLVICILTSPVAVFAKKGEKNYNKGREYEKMQQWEQAAKEYALAVASNPSDTDYQLHYKRAMFNASQAYMVQGRALAEKGDYTGAYNAFSQAYGYDPTNELALSERARMLRLKQEKEEKDKKGPNAANVNPSIVSPGVFPQLPSNTTRSEQRRVINYSNVELESVIRSLAEQLNLNVVFDQTFPKRPISINLKDVTASQALDYIFISQGLFFQRLSRRTILVADAQQRRMFYQQLAIRTFYLANTDLEATRNIVQQILGQQGGIPTTVFANKFTNSLTIRSTPENLRLIGDIIKSIDKDRAEVVMDVNIYEVSRTDLLQLGNQINTQVPNGPEGQIGVASGLSVLGGADAVARAITSPLSSALGLAVTIPTANLIALQKRQNTRLLASTQVHAFDNEQTEANIGQRVPVQTAQTFPFYGGGATNTPGTAGGINTGFGGGGYPVINYEQTGLKLNFTPQVYPNMDVQVKMKIESTDIAGVSGSTNLTPTFINRTISGTARVQNNQTMMLASISQNKASDGRAGLPLLGLIPVLGRLFTAPTKNNDILDIVITVTPRVLRAPDITPDDEKIRPSGTLMMPTPESVESILIDAEREEQLASAREVSGKVNVQLPDATVAYVPAPKINGSVVSPKEALPTQTLDLTNAAPAAQSIDANNRTVPVAPTTKAVEAPVIVKPETKNTVKPEPVKPVFTPISTQKQPLVNTIVSGGEASLHFASSTQTMKVGEKRRFSLTLKTGVPVIQALLAFKFDPKVVAIRFKGVPQSTPFANAQDISMDPVGGGLFVTVAPPTNAKSITGEVTVLQFDVEAIAPGQSSISFNPELLSMIAANGGKMNLKYEAGQVIVK
jgi:general secretion pathway protein D